MTDIQFATAHDYLCEMYPTLREVKTLPRRRLLKRLSNVIEGMLEQGERDPEKLKSRATTVAEQEYASILLIIGMAVLSELAAFLVRKLLEWWFSE